ncbi:amidohydrolase family protein [Caulobacter sp. S45]|uniref:amidohydrolase family protein n=1 Tax=Caulobacter sp. S45 TaxID=1641861 RepID=UPI00131BFB91|nr:amidohydrolase family protein [Caulobacter sp. S45]
MRSLRNWAVGSGTLALLMAAGGASATDLIVHAGALLDGSGQPARSHVSILIHDDRIVSVQSGFQTPPGAQVIDLSNETVTPGFIDCHVHISARLPSRTNATEDWLTHNDLYRAFQGTVFARRMLQQGFTSARDVGGGDETVAIRDAIKAGQISGPRLWVSLEPLGPTAGHGDPHDGLDSALEHPGWDNGLVDTPEQARLKVREHRRRGADLIKLMPSGGIASTGDNPRQQLMTNEEMRVAVETAHALGLKVAAHIYPAGAIENAVMAGVDSVEHGSFATAQTFALMKAHGTYLVPTLTVYDVFYAAARDHPELLTPGTAPKEMANDQLPKRNLPLAIRSGVKIAYGTDIGEGDHAMEFGLLIANGMAPSDALLTATRNAADLIGASDDIGSIAPGKYADLVAVKGDPLSHPELFEHVDFVMQGGKTYRRDGEPTVAGSE